MIFCISMLIPDEWKSKRWLLWDRRETWLVCKENYSDFQKAYKALCRIEHIEAIIKKFEGKRAQK